MTGVQTCALPICQEGAQPHLDHPASRKGTAHGGPRRLCEVFREAREEDRQKTNSERRAGAWSKALTRPGVKMRDRDRQDEQQNRPLRHEVWIPWILQKPACVLCDDVAWAGDVTVDKKAPQVPDHAPR